MGSTTEPHLLTIHTRMIMSRSLDRFIHEAVDHSVNISIDKIKSILVIGKYTVERPYTRSSSFSKTDPIQG